MMHWLLYVEYNFSEVVVSVMFCDELFHFSFHVIDLDMNFVPRDLLIGNLWCTFNFTIAFSWFVCTVSSISEC